MDQLEELKNRFNIKELELNSLLEITQAINSNLPEDAIIKIFDFTLRGNLNVKKLVLYVLSEKWEAKANFGTKDNFFDIIFALSTLEHIKDLKSAIKEISRVLKPNGFVVISSPTESSFYRFCRFLLFGVFEKNVKRNEPGFRGEIDFHFQNAYEIEKKFQESGFTKILQKSLPGFPVPELHRIVKFQK